MAFFDLFSRKKKQETLDQGLEKTKEGFFGKLKRAFVGRRTIDDDFLDELEEIFITGDVGAETTLKIIDRIQARAQRDKYVSENELNEMLCEEISSLLVENKASTAELKDFAIPADKHPYVIMVVGVNGVGKTTTIGKLAYQYKAAGHKVMLGAADTFRAAEPMCPLSSSSSAAMPPLWPSTRSAAQWPRDATLSSSTRQGACTIKKASWTSCRKSSA